MTSSAFRWSLIGPAVWIAILLLAASDQANGTIQPLRPAQILLDESVGSVSPLPACSTFPLRSRNG